MTTITLRRMLGAPPGRVWRAFTDADELAAWFWPDRLATVAELDVRDGGAWSISSGPGAMAVAGEYRFVEPGRHLTFGWRWHGEAEQTTVSVTLSPAASGGTELDIEHTGFAESSVALDHETGWSDCLDRLDRHLAE